MYESQTHSKKGQKLGKYLDSIKAVEKIESRYFKKSYNGKPTKQYLRALKKAERGINTSIFDLL